MTDRRSHWRTTTHVWTLNVDPAHLADCRRRTAELAPTGVLHLVLEVLAYADDEAAARSTKGSATVQLDDDWIKVADDGRGTDTRRDEQGRAVRKPVMSTADVRFQGKDSLPLLPDGHPRRGMSLVAALSSELVHCNRRLDGSWSQTYRYGIPDDELSELPPSAGTGTTVRFRPATGHLDAAGVERLYELARAFAHLHVLVHQA